VGGRRWLSFEDAVTLRDRIRDGLQYPDGLLAVEQAWRGEDGGTVTLLSGFRVVIAPTDATRPMDRVITLEDAKDALRLIRAWEREMGIAGEPEEPEVSREPVAV
jgi:hypothetical protein